MALAGDIAIAERSSVPDATDLLDDWPFVAVSSAAPCRHFLLRQDDTDDRRYRCEVCDNTLLLRRLRPAPPKKRWEMP